MAVPLVSFELREKYLLVVGHGKRDNLSSMVAASAEIYAKVLETNSHFLMVDYRKLEINVHLTEAFNIVKSYEKRSPGLKQIIIAGVFSSAGLEFANYWKEVSVKRGFHIEIFEDIEVAEAWLIGQIR